MDNVLIDFCSGVNGALTPRKMLAGRLHPTKSSQGAGKPSTPFDLIHKKVMRKICSACLMISGFGIGFN
jgi:hypothetical protein